MAGYYSACNSIIDPVPFVQPNKHVEDALTGCGSQTQQESSLFVIVFIQLQTRLKQNNNFHPEVKPGSDLLLVTELALLHMNGVVIVITTHIIDHD